MLHALAILVLAVLPSVPAIAQEEAQPSSFATYQRPEVDLRVKVRFGAISARRSWKGEVGVWVFFPDYTDMSIQRRTDGSVVQLTRGAITYKPTSNGTIFLPEDVRSGNAATSPILSRESGSCTTGGTPPSASSLGRVIQNGGGFRWERVTGQWVQYDDQGKAVSRGIREGTVAVVTRDSQGAISAIQDGSGQSILSVSRDSSGRVTGVNDYSGRSVAYTWQSGKLVSVTDVRGKAWAYGYQGRNLVSITNPRGQATTISYAGDTLKSIRDDDGFGFDFAWDYLRQDKLFYRRITDRVNRVEEAWFDQSGFTWRFDLNGHTTQQFSRNCDALLLRDEHTNVWRLDRDASGRITGLRDPSGAERLYEYVDPVWTTNPRSATIAAMVDPRGARLELDRDAGGNIVAMREAAGSSLERTRALTWGPDNHPVSLRDVVDGASGDRVSTYSYDSYGNQVGVTLPDGVTVAATYDAAGNMLTRTDERGKLWQQSFDAAGNPTSHTNPLGESWTWTYDDAGFIATQTDPEGTTTSFSTNQRGLVTSQGVIPAIPMQVQYDLADRPVAVIDESGSASLYTYDREGRVTSASGAVEEEVELSYFYGGTEQNPSRGLLVRADSEGRQREILFDARSQRVAESLVLPDGTRRISLFEYDPGGLLVEETRPDGVRSSMSYDLLGRPLSKLEAGGVQVSYSWDLWNRALSVTGGGGVTTSIEFDAVGRPVRELIAGIAEYKISYDPAGNPVDWLEPSGRRQRAVYDDAERISQVEYFDAGGSAPARTITFSRNKRGDALSWSDGVTSGANTYDAEGRLLTEATNFGSFVAQSSYTYWPNGLLKSYAGPDGGTLEYTYDGRNRPATVKLPGVGAIAYEAYEGRRPTSIRFPGGVTREMAWDESGLLASVQVRDAEGTSIADRQYQRSLLGDVIQESSGSASRTFNYDGLRRLTSEQNLSGENQSYSWDAASNRSDAAQPWTYGDSNELLNDGSSTYQYDADGNLTGRSGAGSVQGYVYDARGRLSEVQDGTGSTVARYEYDPDGRRIWKEVGGVRTYFHYSYAREIVTELDATGNALRSYGFEHDRSFMTDPLYQRDGNDYAFYHNGANAQPFLATGPTGDVSWAADNEAFGRAQVTTSAIASPLRLPGQYFDAETGLHYNQQRYYDPGLGRYLQTDPIGLVGGLNRYLYAGGSPLTQIDPTGLLCEWFQSDIAGHINTFCTLLSWGGLMLKLFTGATPAGLIPFACTVFDAAGCVCDLLGCFCEVAYGTAGVSCASLGLFCAFFPGYQHLLGDAIDIVRRPIRMRPPRVRVRIRVVYIEVILRRRRR